MTVPAAPSASTGSLPHVISEEFLAVLRRYGVVEAQLFGSTVRGTDRPESDIDLLVTFETPTKLFTQIDLADELTALSGRRVDLMTELHPAFAPYILPTLVPLPL
jgi:predicted nucleotidyltransferase